MKIIFIIIFFIFFNNLSNAKIGKILFKINNEIVTNLDIEKEANYLMAFNKNMDQLEKSEILKFSKESIVKEKVKLIEVKKQYDFEKQKIHSKQLLDRFYKNLGFIDDESFFNFLNEKNLNVDEFKDKLLIEALWNELILRKYSNKMKINEDEIKKRISKIKKESQLIKSYYLLELIFQIDKKENLNKKFSKIKKSIENIGFESTASIYSISESSKNGGKIGWVNENQLSSQLLKEIKKIQVGEFSNPLIVPGGFLIIKINEIKNESKNFDFNEEYKKAISFEKNKQLNEFSSIHFKKIKSNLIIHEN